MRQRRPASVAAVASVTSPIREYRYAREFYQALDSRRSKIPAPDLERCFAAAVQFQQDRFHPGLNFEPLGSSPRHNLFSIRASQSLRVLLALEGGVCVFANAGEHDPMYAWAERRGYYADPAASRAIQAADAAAADPPPFRRALEQALSGAFEEWMLFPHPDQQGLLSVRWTGPARIRGAAGTGKTVVALHRTAVLAARYPEQQVLFTTFSSSLCKLLAGYYRRLPNARDNVEFDHIDRLAYRYSGRQWVQAQAVTDAFQAAYDRLVAGTPLARFGPDYLREEIVRVIKGRGVQEAAAYLDTDRFERLGRQHSFPKAVRAQVWQLREAWEAEMRTRRTVDFIDNVIRARDRMQQREAGLYRAAVVDEAQDMTLVGMQLVRALVAGAPDNPVPDDGLLFLDDAAQRIYPGGFRPRWAGLNIRGRSHILSRNYRNTRAIYAAAAQVRGQVLVAKEDEDDGAVIQAATERESGAKPLFVKVPARGEAPYLRREIQVLLQQGFSPDSIGILCRHNREAERLAQFLARHALACALLKRARDAALEPGLRLGTFDRAKGLEFRAVFIPRMGRSLFPAANDAGRPAARAPAEAQPERTWRDLAQEARLLELDRLYVAMTRARDRLYLIADEEPCAEVLAAADCFDWTDGPSRATG